jgi:hypothetical protein
MTNCRVTYNTGDNPMKCGICLKEIKGDEWYIQWASCKGKGYPIKYNYWHKDCEPIGGGE